MKPTITQKPSIQSTQGIPNLSSLVTCWMDDGTTGKGYMTEYSDRVTYTYKSPSSPRYEMVTWSKEKAVARIVKVEDDQA